MAGPRRLLVGFDASATAWAALARAMATARQNHGCLTVVYVAAQTVPILASPMIPGLTSPCNLHEPAVDALRAAVAGLATDVSVASVVSDDRRVGRALVGEAERRCCDAIVIGSSGGLGARLTGGVGRYLRRHAEVEVIVVTAAPNRSSLGEAPAAGFNFSGGIELGVVTEATCRRFWRDGRNDGDHRST